MEWRKEEFIRMEFTSLCLETTLSNCGKLSAETDVYQRRERHTLKEHSKRHANVMFLIKAREF